MPELPEVETARRLIADEALGRRITYVDDSDTFVCRPHSPGELRAALTGRTLTAARRRGKTMWCETSGDGPDLGIHLGMGGRIVVTSGDGHAAEGGGPRRRDAQPRKPEWDRFTLGFADGGSLVLFDKRRLGRVRLNPGIDALGPDAAEVTPATSSRPGIPAAAARGVAPRCGTEPSAAGPRGGVRVSRCRAHSAHIRWLQPPRSVLADPHCHESSACGHCGTCS